MAIEDDDHDAEGLSPLQAYEAVRRFAQRSGSLPLRLALHAALPQVLHADLLHLLRLNFCDDARANPVAEADVLFAHFCSDLGQAYFRFDPHARAQLLAELDASYPEERRHRSLQVAEFLLQYFERERVGERAGTDAMYRSWIEVERWNALAFADPEAAAEQLAEVLQSAAEPAQAAARLRVGTLARSLAQPLVRHQQLLAYAAGVQALQNQAGEAAQALLRRLGDAPLDVGAVRLPGAGEVLRNFRAGGAAGSAESPSPVEQHVAVGSSLEPGPEPGPEQASYDLYLSCSSDGVQWADTLHASLVGRGLQVFYRRRQALASDLVDPFDRAMDSSRCLLMLWSAGSARSQEMSRELRRHLAKPAQHGRDTLILRLDDSPLPPESDAFLIDDDDLKQAHATGTAMDRVAWLRLLARISARMQGSDAAPTSELPVESVALSAPPALALDDCKYTAFISYAHADDQSWFGWVGHFYRELERSLSAMLRGVRLPPMHLSGTNGPVAGVLGDELKSRIDASFALIMVVHDNYVQSGWALTELAYFKNLFGEQGLRERLYIVAMSESAIHRLAASKEWQQLLPGDSPSWLPFYDQTDPQRPLDIYLSQGIVSPEFRRPFERLRTDLASKIKQTRAAGWREGAMAATRLRSSPEWSASAQPESPRTPQAGEPSGEPAEPAQAPSGGQRFDMAVGYVAGGASAQLDAPTKARLQAMGLRLLFVSQMDLVVQPRPALERAEQLVLPFDNQPFSESAAGGHLQMMRHAWLALGRDPSSITWLDLRTSLQRQRSAGAARWVESLGEHTFLLEDWLQTMEQAQITPASQALTRAPAHAVRLYIESNRHEVHHWQAFSSILDDHWNELVRDMVPPPMLRCRGLPIEQIDALPDLDDADGLILLWGKKTSDALVAQINRVERKISSQHEAPPGLVAYLMPPQRATEPVPAWGWNVLRFQVADQGSRIALTSLAEERDELVRFLQKVLFHWRRRQALDSSGGSTA